MEQKSPVRLAIENQDSRPVIEATGLSKKKFISKLNADECMMGEMLGSTMDTCYDVSCYIDNCPFNNDLKSLPQCITWVEDKYKED